MSDLTIDLNCDVGYPFDCHPRPDHVVPSRGLHYPGSYAELRAWFPDDEARMDYLDWLRWPAGPVCSGCGASRDHDPGQVASTSRPKTDPGGPQ